MGVQGVSDVHGEPLHGLVHPLVLGGESGGVPGDGVGDVLLTSMYECQTFS